MASLATSSDSLAVKFENVDYAVYGRTVNDKNEDLNEPEFKVVKGGEEKVSKVAPEKGWQHLGTATFSIPRLGSIDGFEVLIPDAEERMIVAQKGVNQKLQPKITSILTDYDSDTGNLTYDFNSGVYDAIDLLREPTQRRFLSQQEKQIKNLKASNISPEKMAAILAILQSPE